MVVLPKANEVWHHYKGSDYLIIGIGHDEDGMPVVIYCDDSEPPCAPYYTRRLGTFLQVMDVEAGPRLKAAKVQRFEKTGFSRTRPFHDSGVGFYKSPAEQPNGES